MTDLVFLLSSERSGSNLLRVMMDSHPRFSAPHAPHLIKTFVPLLPLYGDLREPSHFRQLVQDMLRVVTIQLRDWPFVPTADQVLQHSQEPTFPALMRALYALVARHAGKERSFVKDNGAIPFAAELAVLFPHAKYVYLVRDARDVALSWKRSPGHPGGVVAAARMWREEQDQALRFLSMVHQRRHLHLVYYEDLVANPEQQLRAICDHAGEEYDAGMLDFHEGQEARTSAQAGVGWSNLVQPVLSENTGRYQHELSRREQRAVERIAGRPLRQLSYSLDYPTHRVGCDADTIGKLYRAARVAWRHLLRGSQGLVELRQRTQRLSGLREIMQRMANQAPVWHRSQVASAGDHQTRRTP